MISIHWCTSRLNVRRGSMYLCATSLASCKPPCDHVRLPCRKLYLGPRKPRVPPKLVCIIFTTTNSMLPGLTIWQLPFHALTDSHHKHNIQNFSRAIANRKLLPQPCWLPPYHVHAFQGSTHRCRNLAIIDEPPLTPTRSRAFCITACNHTPQASPELMKINTLTHWQSTASINNACPCPRRLKANAQPSSSYY